MKPLMRRLAAKTFTYKFITLLTGIGVIGACTGNFALATGASLILVLVNTILYFIHEVIWGKVSWGREDSR